MVDETRRGRLGRAAKKVKDAAKQANNRRLARKSGGGSSSRASANFDGGSTKRTVIDRTKAAGRGAKATLGRAGVVGGVGVGLIDSAIDAASDLDSFTASGSLSGETPTTGIGRSAARAGATLRRIGDATTLGAAGKIGNAISRIGEEDFDPNADDSTPEQREGFRRRQAVNAAQTNSQRIVDQAAGVPEQSPQQSPQQDSGARFPDQPRGFRGRSGGRLNFETDTQAGDDFASSLLSNASLGQEARGLDRRDSDAAAVASASQERSDTQRQQRIDNIFEGTRLGNERARDATARAGVGIDAQREQREGFAQDTETRRNLIADLTNEDTGAATRGNLLQQVADGSDTTGVGEGVLLTELFSKATVGNAISDLDFSEALARFTGDVPPATIQDIVIEGDSVLVGDRKLGDISDYDSQTQAALRRVVADRNRSRLGGR